MYLGLISLHDSFSNHEKADKFLSILVLVGSVNIPIIKMSVEWWSTLHQPASITISDKPAIDLVMLYPLFGSIVGFAGLVTCLVILSSKLQILRRERNKSWIKKTMFNFAFNSLSEAFLMQSQNGQNHGFFVWSVVVIVFLCILSTFIFYKINIKKLSKKLK